MHFYKVHLPKQSTWDGEDYEDWLDRSYVEGVNRDMKKNEDLIEEILPSCSIDAIPMYIDGNVKD